MTSEKGAMESEASEPLSPSKVSSDNDNERSGSFSDGVDGKEKTKGDIDNMSKDSSVQIVDLSDYYKKAVVEKRAVEHSLSSS